MKVTKTLFVAIFLLAFYASFALGGCINGDCDSGQGTYTYSDGSVYIGQWKNHKRDGLGTLARPKGSKYEGQWKNDEFDGQGMYTYPDGSKYVGHWKHSERNGEGRYSSSGGSKYEGQWKNGMLIGRGILTTSDGKQFIGQFDKKGKLIGKYLPLNPDNRDETPRKNLKIASISSTKKAVIGPNGMRFIYISPGSFMMGSPEGELGRYDNEIQHQVTLSHGFYIQATEVTQRQWSAVMKNNPSFFNNCGDECPVEQVSWTDIQAFIHKLNLLEKNKKYRLPTEAEWEYACRAGNSDAFANGEITEIECNRDLNLDTIGWFCGNSDKKTHPVAQKKPNALGLYDMHGNVSELCQDWFAGYLSEQVSNPQGPTSGIDRTARGGGWDAQSRHCRSACRGALPPEERSYDAGFRLVMTP